MAPLDRHHRGSQEDITICAVVYMESGKRRPKLVAQISKAHFGITPALQEFSKDLERELGNMTAMLDIGKRKRTFDGDGEETNDRDESRRRRRV